MAFVDSLARGVVVLYGIIVILVCMNGWKEKASELVQRAKDYFDAPRRFFYLFIFFILCLLIIFKYTYSYPFQIDDECAMYFLSALVQSQAAILAIVITLTLIAVQLASSHYSPRVIDIFKKDPAIWWFLCYYGFSIFFGLFILMMMQVIQNENLDILTVLNCYSFHISLEGWIYAAYLIAIITFAALFLYLKNVFDLLKPLTIIKKLSDNITKETVLKHIESVKENKKDRTKPIEDDPIQPIMDIIHSSVMKYDIATTRIGLGSVTDRVIEIIDLDGEKEKEISRHVCDRFERVGRLTVNKTDGEATAEVIKNLDGFCETIIEQELGDVAKPAVKSLGLVGRISAENGLEDAVKLVASHLGLVGKVAVEKELGGVAKQAVESLGLVGRVAAENGLEDAAWQTVPRLGLIGKAAAAKQGFDEVVEQAALHLGRIGSVAAVNRFERVAEEAAKSLGSIGTVAVENELIKRSVPIRVIESLGRVGEISAKQERINATLEAATQLGLVGGIAAEKDLEFSTEQAIKCLILVGKIAVESKKLETAIHRVALHLISIGSVAAEKKFKFAARIAAEYLAELTISNKKIVENEIEFGGYPFEEKDRKSFESFVNHYKQRLEELRTQK